MEGKYIVVAGPVIIENGKILLDRDEKDEFFKLPGGRVKEGEELEEACKRKVKEELNAEIEIIHSLSPNVLWENPTTKEKMAIILINYLARILNPEELRASGSVVEFKWFDIKEIREGKHNVSPNTKVLLDKEDL